MLSLNRIAKAAVGLCGMAAAAGVWAGGPFDSRHTSSAVTEPVLKAYGIPPMAFVENRGQTDKRVRYYAQGSRYAFYLTRNEVALSMVKGAGKTGSAEGQAASTEAQISTLAARKSDASTVIPASVREPMTRGVVLHLRFLGSNPRVQITGEERAPGQVNVLRGNDPAQWHANLPRYAQVVYHELWPGVDLMLHEHDQALKYEFRVHPGARLSDIGLAYTGVDGLTLDESGGLQIKTALGVLHDAPPVSYQEIDGERVPVESRYALNSNGRTQAYGFTVGAGYQADHELIIDPGLDYSTFLGGASHECGNGIAVDAAGNAYIVGVTQSPDFPTTSGAFDRTGAASNFSDVFVTKLNPTGTALVYSTFIGGNDFDIGRAIAIDASGNAYIAGQTKSSTFPTTSNAFDRTFNFPNTPRGGIDNYDAFVAKLNATGSALVYSTFLGGATDIDDALGIAVDAAGSAYVTGETGSSDFPVTPGAFRTTRNGAYDAFVTKFNPSGSALAYSTFIGGSQVDFGAQIAVDASNNAYVVGNTRSPEFPTTPGAFDTSLNGEFDLFALKLNAAGSNLVYSTFLGGVDMDSAGSLALDSSGNAYITGSTISLNYPTTPGAFRTVSDGNDGFVTKLNPAGSALVYSTFVGGSGDDGVAGIALDASGNAIFTGGTSSLDFPTTPGAAQPVFNGGGGDAYVAELNANGSALLYSTFLGGTNAEGGSDVALGPGGSIYVTGQTLSTDFPTTPGALDRVWNGNLQIFWADAFVTKLTPSSVPAPAALSSVAASPSSVVGGNGSTGTVTLTNVAPAGDALVSVSSSNDAIANVPTSVRIPAGSSSAPFAIVTSAVATNAEVTISASYNGVTRTTTLTVMSPPRLQSLALNPFSVVGGNSSQGTVTLTNPAPAGGAVVSLTNSNPAAATVPASVTVAAGATTATFTASTASVAASTSTTLGATFGGGSSSAVLTVTPPITLTSITVNPASVTGGTTSIGTVTLTSAAPSGGFAVAVSSSNNAVADGPQTGSVTVAQGATSASFAIGTNTVSASTPVTFTASGGGVTRATTLTVTPSSQTPPAQTATLTVTVSGRSGTSVSSSPAGISAPVGSSRSASFAVGTVITLTVSDGRSAVWSGAVSSGGNKTKTLTFILNGNASVTANVQ